MPATAMAAAAAHHEPHAEQELREPQPEGELRGQGLGRVGPVRPDLDVSPVGVVARMAGIRALFEAEQSRLFATRSITPADFPVLGHAAPADAATPGDPLAARRRRRVDRGTVTERVDRLEGLGLVRRRGDAADSRVRWVELTAAGLEVVEDLIPRHLELEEDLLSGLSRAQKAWLAEDLAVLLGNLESRG